MNFKNTFRRTIPILAIVMVSFIQGCDFFNDLFGEKEELSYFISDFESLSKVNISGSIKDGSRTATNLESKRFQASESTTSITIKNDMMVDLFVSIPSKNGTFRIDPSASWDAEVAKVETDYSLQGYSGKLTVSNHSADILDLTRGKISYRLKGVVTMRSKLPPYNERDLDFDISVSFDNKNDPAYEPPVVTSNPPSGSGSSGSGSGSGSTNLPAVCGSGNYNGPTGSPQRDSFCQAAFAYICKSGLSKDSPQVKSICQQYNTMNQLSNPKQNCPYCS